MKNPGGSGSLKSYLVDKFITSNDRIKWGALGAALTGGTIYTVYIGLVRGVLSVGAAIDMFVGGLVGTVVSQGDRFFESMNRQLGDVWTLEIDLGLFQLPFNLVVVLLALAVLAIGVRWFGS